MHTSQDIWYVATATDWLGDGNSGSVFVHDVDQGTSILASAVLMCDQTCIGF